MKSKQAMKGGGRLAPAPETSRFKVKLSRLNDERAQAALNRLLEQPMPARTAVLMRERVHFVGERLERLNEARLDLCKRLGHLSPDGQKYEFDTPEIEREFQTNFAEMLDTEIALAFAPFRVEDLGGAWLSPRDADWLSWLIADVTEEVGEEEKANAAHL